MEPGRFDFVSIIDKRGHVDVVWPVVAEASALYDRSVLGGDGRPERDREDKAQAERCSYPELERSRHRAAPAGSRWSASPICASSEARRNGSRSPSRTASVSAVSCWVRRSFTIR